MIIFSKRQKLTKYLILIVCLVGATITSLEQTNGQEQTTGSKDALTGSPSLSYSYSLHDPIEIGNDTNFTIPNGVSSGDGTKGNPFIIEGWNITTSGIHGIYIYNTTAHFVIRNCWISTGNNGEINGIYLNNINGTAALDTNFCQNNFGGIGLTNASFNSLTNNTCINNFVGIIFFEGINYNNTLTGNTCLNNLGGIVIQEAHYTSVTNNTCISNEWDNIFLGFSNYTSLTNNYCSNSQFGIDMVLSFNSSLANNNCSNNWYGIFLDASGFNLLGGNFLAYNGYGVYLTENSDNNSIHHNSFIYNTNSSQANDNGTYNQWFDTETNEGNYWSDYSGIGDYEIDGSTSSSDPYPLDVPPVVAEFTPLKGYFLGFVSSLVLVSHMRRKRYHSHK